MQHLVIQQTTFIHVCIGDNVDESQNQNTSNAVGIPSNGILQMTKTALNMNYIFILNCLIATPVSQKYYLLVLPVK